MTQIHAHWLQQHNRRVRLRHAWRAFFADWDILLCPTTATTAFAHDHQKFGRRTVDVNGAVQPHFQQLFWAGLITGPYLPSTVFPSGVSQQGLPIGIQAIGSELCDYTTIDFTRLLGARWVVSRHRVASLSCK